MSEQQAYAREESYAERHNQRIRELEARIQKAREILVAAINEAAWFQMDSQKEIMQANAKRALEALEGK